MARKRNRRSGSRRKKSSIVARTTPKPAAQQKPESEIPPAPIIDQPNDQRAEKYPYSSYIEIHGQHEKYRVEAQSSLDKALLSVTLPTLGFSLAYIEFGEIDNLIPYFLSWGFLFFGVMSTLASYYFTVWDCGLAIRENDECYKKDEAYTHKSTFAGKMVTCTNHLSLIAVVVGTLFLVLSIGSDAYQKERDVASENATKGSGRHIPQIPPKQLPNTEQR